MHSLQEIKNRLESINSTKKITKAMKLVSTAKLQKSKNNLESIKEFYYSVYDMFNDLLLNIKDVSKIFPQKNKKDSTIYLVITSDLGLCGGYNINILKTLLKEKKKQDKIIVVGNKGFSYLSCRNIETFSHYLNIGDEPNYFIASEISNKFMNEYLLGNVNNFKIVHTKFINSITFVPNIKQIFPFEKNNKEIKTNNIKSIAEFEPSPDVVLKNSLPLYISTMVFGLMTESKVAEISSRRVAMENATDNAEDLIKNLDLEYNRVRQSKITQQISEIVAGSNSEDK